LTKNNIGNIIGRVIKMTCVTDNLRV
jgi:hypothetical protein